jgi:hypothetical protein
MISEALPELRGYSRQVEAMEPWRHTL